MDIDLAALRALERERDISLDVIIPAIEQALLLAYHRTEGAYKTARVDLDRKTGHVVVWVREDAPLLEDGTRGDPGPEFDDTPAGFGRVAASTARQVIVQRLRELEDDAVLGDFRGREGDIITGVIQQSQGRTVLVDLGTVEGALPQAEQVPGETYKHGERIRCYVVTSTASGSAATWSASSAARAGRRSGCRARTPTWSASCSRWRCRRSRTAP